MKSITGYLLRLVGLLFVYAGVNKLFWPSEATLALETIGFGKSAATFLVTAALIAELYLGALLLAGIDAPYSITSSMLLMLLFTGYMFYLSTLAHPPSCGCLGLTGIFNSSRHAAVFGVLRNCLILWILKFAYDADRPRLLEGSGAAGARVIAT